jgi:hypothetical protein
MVVHGKARRFVVGILIAVLVAMFVSKAHAQLIPTPEICKTTSPDDWAWWYHMCWNYPTASGAYPQRGFLLVK